jgi:Sec-independent protein secretion pathway component TatC
MEEGNVNMLNLNRRLVSIILVLMVSMLKINLFMAPLGQIYDRPSVEYKMSSKKIKLICYHFPSSK